MAVSHLASGHVTNVLPSEASLAEVETIALFKGPHLEVIRMVLLAGKKIPPHQVSGPITIHCLKGEVDVGVEIERKILRQGDLLYLAGNVKHDLLALTDAALLVSVVLLSNTD